MDYIKALIIKFVMTTAILWIILGAFFGVSFTDILVTSVVLSGVSFIIGDVFILPKFGNMVATIADFGLAFFGIWILGSFLFDTPAWLGTVSFFLASAITIGEFFFHGYMKGPILDGYSSTEKQDLELYADKNLQTEFASDEEIKTETEEDKNPKQD